MMTVDDIMTHFIKGKHAKIVANTFDTPDFQLDGDPLVYVLGSLVFLGRMDDAEIIYESRLQEFSAGAKTEAQFYLSLGFCRLWRFEKARKYLRQVAIQARRADARQRFFVYQGLSFYHFMSCHYLKSLKYSQKSYLEALKSQYFYGRALALDLQGHAQLAVGEIFRGIQSLEKAHEYFTMLGNQDHIRSIARSLVSAKARHSIDLEENFAALQQLAYEAEQEENNYSLAGSYLNICRLHCLVGQVTLAEKLLNQAAEIIQKSSHQKNAVLLNFRKAYCAYLRGQKKALSYLQSIPENAIHPADLRTRMQYLGLELAIKRSFHEELDPDKVTLLKQLTHRSAYNIGARILARQAEKRTSSWGKDPLGDLLDELHDPSLSLEEKVELIQKTGYWSFIYDLIKVPRSSRTIAINFLPGLVIVMNQGDVQAHKVSPGTQIIKFFDRISRGKKSKQQIIESLWEYEYNPLRHDSLIYGLLSRVRSILGDSHDWILSDDQGYSLDAQVNVLFHQYPDLAAAASTEQEVSAELSISANSLPADVNQRQFMILRHLEQNDFISLKVCQDLFKGVSKVTLSRDLSFLVEKKLLVRKGKGRNTSYLKVSKLS